MERKTELDSLEGREPDTPTTVLASEELTLFRLEGVPIAGSVGAPGRVASAESIPGNVAPSESTAYLGVALELSAFETAVVSGALRGMPSSCLAIDARFSPIA